MRKAFFAVTAIATISNLFAGTVSVNTTASVTAPYGTVAQTYGPFPWSDVGFTASANVSSGTLNVNTGGSTSYALNTPIIAGETFTSGATVLNLGYTPGWTGDFSSGTPANGNLGTQFVYNIGPINGSQNLFNVPLSTPAANGDLSSALDSGVGVPVTSSQTASGLGITAGLTLEADACIPFCIPVASVSFGFHVGSQIDSTVSATPTVGYNDLLWYSKTQTYDPANTLVLGAGGNVANTFNSPSSLGLVTGDTVYMNILPVVQLDMPVTTDAGVAVPASISVNWNVFGITGSYSHSLGNLYSLRTGPETFDFSGTFYGDSFYSIPLLVTDTCDPAIPCPTYQTPASFTGPDNVNSGIPPNVPPSVLTSSSGPISGGYGGSPLGNLFPGDPSSSPVCGPSSSPDVGDCINEASIAFASAPEPGGLILPGMGLLILAGMLRRKLSSAL